MLLPGVRSRTFQHFSVPINVLLIALVTQLFIFIVVHHLGPVLPNAPDVINPITTPFYVESQLNVFIIFRTRWASFFFNICDLVIVPMLLTLAVMLAGAAPQARRVFLWGAVGLVFWQLAAIALFVGLYQGLTWHGILFDPVTAAYALVIMGLGLGVWVGIQRPDAFAHRWLAWASFNSTVIKNTAMLVSTWIYIAVILWAVLKVTTLLAGEPALPSLFQSNTS